MRDQYWMNKAVRLAKISESNGEVPVGALILDSKGKLLAVGVNTRQRENAPTGHAEIMAISRASRKLNSWRLDGCTLYSTLEPCVMCAGAIIQSRIANVVFGALDPKGGALKSLYNLGSDPRLNHRLKDCRHLESPESVVLLTQFFKKKRKSRAPDIV